MKEKNYKVCVFKNKNKWKFSARIHVDNNEMTTEENNNTDESMECGNGTVFC